MERKSKVNMTKKELEEFAEAAISDDEQKLWEEKKLGNSSKHAKKSSFYKPPSKLISIRIPDEVLEGLKKMADAQGLRYQTYIVSLLKKHIRVNDHRGD